MLCRLRRALVCLSFIFAAGISSQAHASRDDSSRAVSEAVRVQPGHCVDGDALVRRVEDRLGRHEIDARVEVDVDARTLPVRYRLLRDGAVVGERTLTNLRGPCHDVTEAVALAVAIAIDQLLLEVAARPEPPPPPAPPAKEPPSPPPPPPTPKEEVALRMDGAALVTAGVLPAPSVGGEVGAEATIAGALGVRLAALLSAKTSASLAEGSVSTSLAALSAEVCAPVLVLRPSVRGCLGAAVGRLHASGEGSAFPLTYTRNLAWVAVAGRLEVWLPLSHGVGLLAAGEAFVPLLRARLDVAQTPQGEPVVASSLLSPVGGMLGVGPAVAF